MLVNIVDSTNDIGSRISTLKYCVRTILLVIGPRHWGKCQGMM